MQGKLYIGLWLELGHSLVQSSPDIQSLLSSLSRLSDDQEVKLSYKTALTASDFMLRSCTCPCELLLDLAVLSLKWSLKVPLWHLFPPPISSFLQHLSQTCVFSDLDLSFTHICELNHLLYPHITTLSNIISFLITNLREPLECYPALMKQLVTSLEFYEPKVKFVGRIRSFGMEITCELPNLLHFMHHRKAFPFL